MRAAVLPAMLCLPAACSARVANTGAPGPRPTAAAPAHAPSVSAATAPTANGGLDSGAAAGETAAVSHELPLSRPLTFERVLAEDVRSIALGRPRVAVLAAEPWWFDGGRWRTIPRPAALHPPPAETEHVEIFFGRDDRPRIMGWRTEASGSASGHVYQRYTARGWVVDRGEIGRFGAGPPAPLYGVLGHADPEVVCRPGDACIIKRLTGWQTIPELFGPARVVLCGAAVWAVNTAHLAELGASGWRVQEGPVPWRAPGGVFEVPGSGVWVTEPGLDRLHRLEHDRWVVERSPIAGPRDIWASSAREVWLVGDGGVAYHDGERWARVEGVDGPLARVLGRSATEVWLGGPSGLWRGGR